MAQAVPDSVLAETAWNKRRLYALSNRIGPSGTDYDLTLPVTAPAHSEEIGEIPELGEDDVGQAVEQTREAAKEWREFSVDERAEVLTKFANLAADNRKELLDLLQLETGKSRAHALEETIDVPQNADYYADKGPGILATESRASGIPFATSAEVQYDSKGVVGIISPWNYPLVLSFADAIPALLAGNGVVLKPDEKTPFTALRLAELLEEAGLPEGVVTIVTGDGPTVGSAIIERVDYLTFTGSSETGKIVAEQAGRNLIDCSLELSGKNPMIILDDADVEEAARGAVQGSFTNAGQLCLANERIYVHEDIYDDFLDEFVSQTESLELGADFEFDADVGSLIDSDQLERVQSHVADAVESGATVHTGGNARSEIGPYFYEPTILTDVPATSLPACEETFGPLAVVESVSSAEEAIEKANDSDHGLNASVWSGDRERAKEIAREIESGTVCINDPFLVGWASYDAPMGGVKESGIGRRHGPEGLKRYTEPKTIATSAVGPLGPIPGVPDELFAKGFSAVSNIQRRLNQLRR
ncbi:succinic semialdehyde dehydrogenase [Halovenus sp. HT40]|uniref:succinic semialdehyde dehydrogenase n=1 Tax=Halovenus sp. HT40 TaxID=3126691 RepID=UPI00300EA26F